MDEVTYFDARRNLKAIMDRATDDVDHTVITRLGGEPIIMLSSSERSAM